MTKSIGIQLVHSTSYYPQGNGLAESSNKSLVRIIKKLLEDNKRSWDSKLKFALWADRVTNKKSRGNSPFKMVYGVDVVFPIQLILPVAKFFQEEQDEMIDRVRKYSERKLRRYAGTEALQVRRYAVPEALQMRRGAGSSLDTEHMYAGSL
eukprot:PITA_24838